MPGSKSVGPVARVDGAQFIKTYLGLAISLIQYLSWKRNEIRRQLLHRLHHRLFARPVTGTLIHYAVTFLEIIARIQSWPELMFHSIIYQVASETELHVIPNFLWTYLYPHALLVDYHCAKSSKVT